MKKLGSLMRTLWFCALLQPLLRHTTMRATLDELGRNADLRALGGMESAADVPQEWNMTRFIALLGTEPFQTLVHEVFGPSEEDAAFAREVINAVEAAGPEHSGPIAVQGRMVDAPVVERARRVLAMEKQ